MHNVAAESLSAACLLSSVEPTRSLEFHYFYTLYWDCLSFGQLFYFIYLLQGVLQLKVNLLVL